MQHRQVQGLGRPLLLLGLLASCAGGRDAPPPGLPRGFVLLGDAAAAAPLLGRAAGLTGTPLGTEATALWSQVFGCKGEFEATLGPGPDDSGGPWDFGCAAGSASAALAATRGAAPLAFAWSGAEGIVLAGRAQPAGDGGLLAEFRLWTDGEEGALGLLPGADGPGPAVLGSPESLAHARGRSARGIDLSELVAEGGEWDEMIRLRSALFTRRVLDGTWELLLLPPREGQRVPPLVLALGHRSSWAAARGLDVLLDDLRATWGVDASERPVPGGEARCLQDLRVLPELAPCFFVGERALAVGWNGDALADALQGVAPSPEEPSSWARLQFDRLPEADARIARARAGDASAGGDPGAAPAPAAAWPWDSLELRARRERGSLTGSLELRAAARSSGIGAAP